MGLAAPKNRSRISNDPQNTTWANNTDRFGHRILTAQGWKPGSSLGATDAAHAAHYTAASHSHIRVLLKDDNLGLGAKRGSERAENFGLSGLDSVLGRLNGRVEEVKKEEERQEKIQQRAYVYRKYGFMNFVSGGLLVGDKIEKGIKREAEVKAEVKSEPESSDNEAKSKKRKRATEDTEIKKEEREDEAPKLKRKKKSMNLREEAANQDAPSESIPILKKEKKAKKDKKDKKSKSTSETSTTDSPASTSEALSDKARRKAEKRARKEEKKLKKALKKAAKEAAQSNPTAEDPSSESEEEEDSSSTPATGTSTPASGTSGLTYTPRGMHAVRQRYIRQKKMASMDPQALKEIFMVKTPS